MSICWAGSLHDLERVVLSRNEPINGFRILYRFGQEKDAYYLIIVILHDKGIYVEVNKVQHEQPIPPSAY